MPRNREGGTWPGGYVSKERSGRLTYVIERSVRGKKHHVSTRAHSLRGAVKQLERFEADPANYKPEGDAEDALLMTPEIVLEFFEWQHTAKGVTHKHARETGNLLTDWALALRGLDLRRVSLRDHIRPALAADTMPKARIAAIKVFYAWLRREKNLLTSANDPTLDIAVPKARPAQNKTLKVVPAATALAIVEHLDQTHRDCLHFLMATGCHVTELERFAREDASELRVYPEGTKAANGQTVFGAVVLKHKNRAPILIGLSQQAHVDAAARIRERRAVPRRLNDAIKQACRKARVDEFTLGRMRHSFMTWAAELGGDPGHISSFVGHRDKRTSDDFYIRVSLPTVLVPTIALH